MKRLRYAFVFAVLTTLLACTSTTINTLTIDQPSVDETNFAEMRDFYVIGSFSDGVARPGDINIKLYKIESYGMRLVREIESQVDESTGTTPLSSIYQDYPEGNSYGIIMVPDLVEEPGGFLNPNNKVVVTDTYYAGLIFGGATKDFDTTYTDNDGQPYEDLTEGTYRIVVTGLSDDLYNATATKDITMGLTHAALGRFSPISSKTKLFEFAAAHDYRVYSDNFPGYFAMDGNLYEIKNRWMPNNSIEVVNDTQGTIEDNAETAENDMLVYNVKATSATNTVETAAILRYELADSSRTLFHYYDVGEPSLTYVDADGASQTVDGSFSDFAAGDRLVVVRTEAFTNNGTEEENLYNVADPLPKTLDFDVTDGVTVEAAQELSVYGVARPIASSVTPGTHSHEFMPDNRTATITYTVTDAGGGTVDQSTHDVSLNRIYDAATPTVLSNSIYEFRSELTPNYAVGDYTVTMQGYDNNGAEVEGTREEFTLHVE